MTKKICHGNSLRAVANPPMILDDGKLAIPQFRLFSSTVIDDELNVLESTRDFFKDVSTSTGTWMSDEVTTDSP